ncbi:amidohydrolase [Candidatus Thorarchaeota archaeon]|nr:MAG: amidohydrolase [Candidatus Thorarchaeota archaeon]
MSKSLLVKNGYVLTLNEKREIIPDGAVYIEDNNIRAVGRTESLKHHKADTVIDAHGSIVMPGLIDTHMHLAQGLIRGCADDVSLVDWLKNYVWVLQGNFTPEDGQLSAELCMAEMIRTGTTAFIECMIHSRYGFNGIAETLERVGMRGALSKIIMDSTGYADSEDIMYHGMVEEADECMRETDEMYKKWHKEANERIQVWYGLRSLGAVTDELFREVTEAARSKKTRMTMHLGEVVDDVRYVKSRGYANLTSFAKDMKLLGPDMVFAHGIHFEDEELEVLAETGSHISHCPASNTKLASGFAKVPQMLDRDVSVSLGCDGGPSNNTYDMVREMRLAALIHKPVAQDPLVVSAEDVIEMATLAGARAMGIDHLVGSLEVGKRADLIVVSLEWVGLNPSPNPVSNLVYAGSGRDVTDVIVDGKILMRDRELLTIDEQAVVEKARESIPDLLDRSGVEITPKWPVV